MNECIDCGAQLKYGKCPACGWQEPQKKAYVSNHQCAYEYFNARCPLPGTMTESTKSDNDTPFYCFHHQESRGNPKKQAFIYHEIMAGRLKGNILSEVQELMDKAIENLNATNPELFWLPTTPQESREYQKMIMAYIRNVSFQKTSLPYDKSKKYAEELEYNEAELLHGAIIR